MIDPPGPRPRREFDVVKFACWLVAGIMGIYAVDLMIGLIGCAWLNASHGAIVCSGEKLGELLATLLATAVAFAGGLLRSGPPSPPAGS